VAPRPLRLRIDTQTEDVRIELIPLIDVIFCILTFFLLSAVGLSRQQAINVDIAVPKASTGKPQGRQILVVSLNELGQIYVDKQPVPTDKEFRQRLRDYRQKNPEGLMALYASANASYNQVVQVLDLLRDEGGERVALATILGKPSSPLPSVRRHPPATGVPSYTPYPGEGSLGTYPYGTPNPLPVTAQPQVPGNPGQLLPGVPGVSPGSPPPLPGQSGVNPGNSAHRLLVLRWLPTSIQLQEIQPRRLLVLRWLPTSIRLQEIQPRRLLVLRWLLEPIRSRKFSRADSWYSGGS
jgi:biopolymer transport protein ExbD